ncbi:MAG: class I SAM-dependent methyltransferase [Proteobacteria bacterium]|nr:class I SAM-dependent methyltransferase [Pseudomonadota bacterium]
MAPQSLAILGVPSRSWRSRKARAVRSMSMSARLPSLSDRIRLEIETLGSLPFSRFMDLALYDPLEGYYTSGRAAVGREGDFFTSVSIGPVFGAVLAGQFLEMWEALGRPSEFRLVEQGANDGRLSSDILKALSETPLARVPLTIIEPASILRQKQTATLAGCDVRWVERPEDLPPFEGVHFSNELFDALPFDILEAHAGAWHEMQVHADEVGFSFKPAPHPIQNIDLPPRPDGYRTELRRHQRDLIETLSARLRRGFLLAIDYGMPCAELLAPHRSGGTLACYARHRRDEAPLENPGQKDITAHVDFTALAQDAADCGFALEGYTDQHHFLVGAASGLLKSLDGPAPSPSTLKILRSLRTLLHPETMGTQFKSILFSKKAPLAKPLSGFQHAGDCRFLLE